jgi:hypothetical protein
MHSLVHICAQIAAIPIQLRTRHVSCLMQQACDEARQPNEYEFWQAWEETSSTVCHTFTKPLNPCTQQAESGMVTMKWPATYSSNLMSVEISQA